MLAIDEIKVATVDLCFSAKIIIDRVDVPCSKPNSHGHVKLAWQIEDISWP